MFRRRFRMVLKTLAVIVITAILLPIAVGGTVLLSFLYLPLPVALPPERPTITSLASRIYDAQGNEIGVIRTFEQSIPVKKEDIPQILKHAVISAEDKNFYSHRGVDLRGSLRALYADVRNKQISQGGSTITQQYVKNTYTGNKRTIGRKLQEAVLASQLDREIDKDELLFRYLDTIYLGEGAYGVGAASETYFRKPVSQLDASEAATLAGLIPAPSRYTPRQNLEGAESKRKIVLAAMRSEGYLTKADYDAAVARPLWLTTQGPPPPNATLVHPREDQQIGPYPYFVDYVERYLFARYGEDRVRRGGFRIQTTLDPAMQAEAEASVATELGKRGVSADLEMSLVAVEPPTGYVKALVGGRNFQASQVNLALGGCPTEPTDVEVQVRAACWDDENRIEGGGSGRQPGSAWKPVVLAAAYDQGIQPKKTYSGATYSIPGCKGRKCTIQNFGGASYGTLDLKTATQKSVNGVYARLFEDVGGVETAEMAKRLGLSSVWFSDGRHGASFSLGVMETSPLEMASAFGVFAARGERFAPTPVIRVVDRDGKVLEDNSNREPERAVSEAVADNVTDALEGVISGGTASARGKIGRPAAGKTGTSQDSYNAWFVGYTPTLSTAVWIGYPKEQKAVVLPSYGKVEGGEAPTATWARFMKAALKDVPITKFNEPAPIEKPADVEVIREQQVEPDSDEIEPGAKRQPEGTGLGGPYDQSGGGSGGSGGGGTTTTARSPIVTVPTIGTG